MGIQIVQHKPTCCDWKVLLGVAVLVFLLMLLASLGFVCFMTMGQEAPKKGEFVVKERQVIHKIQQKVDPNEVNRSGRMRHVIKQCPLWVQLFFIPLLLVLGFTSCFGIGSGLAELAGGEGSGARRLAELADPALFDSFVLNVVIALVVVLICLLARLLYKHKQEQAKAQRYAKPSVQLDEIVVA